MFWIKGERTAEYAEGFGRKRAVVDARRKRKMRKRALSFGN